MAQQYSLPISAAVKEFQNTLDLTEQAQLLAIHGPTTSDVDAVLILTAEIDSKRQNARCTAGRLRGILQYIQQFTSVVDTFVTSNPSTAALVWGSVRFTLVLASNFTSFFDKLLENFLGLQSLCPRLSEYRMLYPESLRLQNIITSFYANIVNFCTKAVMAMKRNVLQSIVKAFWTSFDNDFSECTKTLQTLRQEFDAEICLASNKAAAKAQELQLVEYQEAARIRRSTRAFFRQVSQHLHDRSSSQVHIRQDEERVRKQGLLDELSAYDQSLALYRLRKQRYGSTGTWLSGTLDYSAWAAEQNDSVFWLSGIIGSGKSILTAAIIDDILKRRSSKAQKISYFFCQYDNTESLQPKIILKSLLRQCLTVDTLPKEIETQIKAIVGDRSPDLDELANLFSYLLDISKERDYIIIDGLDELSYDNRESVIATLASIVSANSSLHLFLASRQDIGSQLESHLSIAYRSSTSCGEVDEDISNYVRLSIAEKLSKGKLVVGDAVIVAKIQAALIEGAKRMFLWVYFQIEEICRQTCDHDILEVITSLPKDLQETYERAFTKIRNGGQKKTVTKMFKWIAVVERPLSLLELREAIAIYPGQPYSMSDRLVNDTNSMVSWCHSMVIVDEDEQIVQFAHHSVKEFFTTASESSNEIHKLALQNMYEFVGEICCTYLSFNDFKSQMIRMDKTEVSLRPLGLVQTALSDKHMSLTARSLSAVEKICNAKNQVNKGKAAYRNLQLLSMVQKHGSECLQSMQRQHPFLSYSIEFWINHTKRIDSTSIVYKEWKALFVSSDVPGAMNWTESDIEDSADHVIECIVSHNHSALLKLLIKATSDSEDTWGILHGNPQPMFNTKILRWIARTGSPELFKQMCEVYPRISIAMWQDTIDCALFGRQSRILRYLISPGSVVHLPSETTVAPVQVFKPPLEIHRKVRELRKDFVTERNIRALERVLKAQVGYKSQSAVPSKIDKDDAEEYFNSLYIFLTENWDAIFG